MTPSLALFTTLALGMCVILFVCVGYVSRFVRKSTMEWDKKESVSQQAAVKYVNKIGFVNVSFKLNACWILLCITVKISIFQFNLLCKRIQLESCLLSHCNAWC